MVQMISRIDGANDYERHPPSTGEPQVKGRISLLHHTQTKNEFIFFNSLAVMMGVQQKLGGLDELLKALETDSESGDSSEEEAEDAGGGGGAGAGAGAGAGRQTFL